MGGFNCRNCHCNKNIDEEFEEKFNEDNEKKEETTIVEPNLNNINNINKNMTNEKNIKQNNYTEKINDINTIEETNNNNNINLETNNNCDDIILNNKNQIDFTKNNNIDMNNNNINTIESTSERTDIKINNDNNLIIDGYSKYIKNTNQDLLKGKNNVIKSKNNNLNPNNNSSNIYISNPENTINDKKDPSIQLNNEQNDNVKSNNNNINDINKNSNLKSINKDIINENKNISKKIIDNNKMNKNFNLFNNIIDNNNNTNIDKNINMNNNNNNTNIDKNNVNNNNNNNTDIEKNNENNNIINSYQKNDNINKKNNNIKKQNQNELKLNKNDSSEININITEQFTINKSLKNIKEYDIGNINFGYNIEDQKKLTKDEKKLYEEAQKNLEQFYPPEQTEIDLIHKNLKKISLKNILTNEKINQIQNDEKTRIFHGELNKLINYELSVHNQMYSMRFCILTIRDFKYYKSKAQFLRNLKPLCVVPIENILRVNLAKINKKSNKTDHMIICNKRGVIKHNKSTLGHMFDNVEYSSFINNEENNESLLIFTSENVDFIYKWFMLLQCMIDKNKKNENQQDNQNNIN